MATLDCTHNLEPSATFPPDCMELEVFGWHDGFTSGVARCHLCRCAFAVDMVDCSDELLIGVYRLMPITEDAFFAFVTLLDQYPKSVIPDGWDIDGKTALLMSLLKDAAAPRTLLAIHRRTGEITHAAPAAAADAKVLTAPPLRDWQESGRLGDLDWFARLAVGQ